MFSRKRKKVLNFIDGKIQSNSDEVTSIYDPSLGLKIKEVVNSNDQDLQNSINSSLKGFELWSKFTPLKRSRVIAK